MPSGHGQISHMASFLTLSSTIHTRYIDYRLYYLYTIHYILWAGILSLVYIIYHTVIYYILCTINWSIVLSHIYIYTYIYAYMYHHWTMVLVDSYGWYGSIDIWPLLAPMVILPYILHTFIPMAGMALLAYMAILTYMAISLCISLAFIPFPLHSIPSYSR